MRSPPRSCGSRPNIICFVYLRLVFLFRILSTLELWIYCWTISETINKQWTLGSHLWWWVNVGEPQTACTCKRSFECSLGLGSTQLVQITRFHISNIEIQSPSMLSIRPYQMIIVFIRTIWAFSWSRTPPIWTNKKVSIIGGLRSNLNGNLKGPSWWIQIGRISRWLTQYRLSSMNFFYKLWNPKFKCWLLLAYKLRQ